MIPFILNIWSGQIHGDRKQISGCQKMETGAHEECLLDGQKEEDANITELGSEN